MHCISSYFRGKLVILHRHVYIPSKYLYSPGGKRRKRRDTSVAPLPEYETTQQNRTTSQNLFYITRRTKKDNSNFIVLLLLEKRLREKRKESVHTLINFLRIKRNNRSV